MPNIKELTDGEFFVFLSSVETEVCRRIIDLLNRHHLDKFVFNGGSELEILKCRSLIDNDPSWVKVKAVGMSKVVSEMGLTYEETEIYFITTSGLVLTIEDCYSMDMIFDVYTSMRKVLENE